MVDFTGGVNEPIELRDGGYSTDEEKRKQLFEVKLINVTHKLSVRRGWKLVITVLSRASTHGCSQLKCQNLGVGGYTEKVLKWFNYPQARAHPGCEASCHLHYRFVHTSSRPA